MTVAVRKGEVIGAQTFGPFEPSDVHAYAEASLDDNPLHVDPALAAMAGLARSPIHGMLIMGCFESYLRAWQPDAVIAKLSSKFIKPVLVGEAIDVSGKVVQAAADAPAVVRLTVKSGGGDLVCLAEAFLAA